MSKRKKLLIYVWLITLIAIMVISYIFAQTSSNPEFLTKIDKTIFDVKNEPAKYVISLPDEKQSITRKTKSKAIDILKSDNVKITNPNEAAQSMPKIDNLEELQNANSLSNIVNNNDKPWIAYSKQVSTQPNYYKISVIIKNSGLSNRGTNSIIKTIHEDTSLSFSPYSATLKKHIENARKYGNETYMDVNIKYDSPTFTDFGPKSIDLSLDENKILKQFENNFLSTPLPFGGFIFYGKLDDIENNAEKMKSLLNFIAEKGYLIADATENNSLDKIKTSNLARVKVDFLLNDVMDENEVLEFLEEVEISAVQKGYAVIVVDPKPLNIVTLMKWFDSFSEKYDYEEIRNGATINKPFSLVPVSSLVVE